MRLAHRVDKGSGSGGDVFYEDDNYDEAYDDYDNWYGWMDNDTDELHWKDSWWNTDPCSPLGDEHHGESWYGDEDKFYEVENGSTRAIRKPTTRRKWWLHPLRKWRPPMASARARASGTWQLTAQYVAKERALSHRKARASPRASSERANQKEKERARASMAPAARDGQKDPGPHPTDPDPGFHDTTRAPMTTTPTRPSFAMLAKDSISETHLPNLLRRLSHRRRRPSTSASRTVLIRKEVISRIYFSWNASDDHQRHHLPPLRKH